MLIADVPLVHTCPHCGHEIMRMPLDMAYEAMVADAVQGELCTRGKEGIDVQNSRLFPGLTFQVKRSKPTKPEVFISRNNGKKYVRGEKFAWGGYALTTADFYVLFGETSDEVIPFLLSAQYWIEHSALFQTRRLLFIQTEEFSRRGPKRGHIHHNRGWECVIHHWPDDLLRQIGDSLTPPQLRLL